MNKSPKQSQEKTNETKEMNKTVQDLEMEIEAIRKTQTEGNLEIENLRKQARISLTEYIYKERKLSTR